MLYHVNVTLHKLLYRKGLLVEVYKHLIYKFYITGQFVSWNFGKFWKQILSFSVRRIGTCISVTQKEMLCLNYEFNHKRFPIHLKT